jgi:hypothetical protein
MRLAAEKVSALQSANFEVEASFTLRNTVLPSSGTANLKGTLQDGGAAVQTNVVVDALVSSQGSAGETFRILGNADVISIGKQETYLHLNSLATEPDQNLFKKDLLALMTGKWWQLSSNADKTAVPGGSLTPSPGILKLQSQVVRVLSDEGAATVGDHETYHYTVGIDPEKLLQFLEQGARDRKETFDREAMSRSIAAITATGEMWIDTETFFLRRVSWKLTGLQEQAGGMIVDGSFTATLTNENAAPPILPPKDAQLLTPSLLLGGEVQAPSSSLLPE